MRRILDHTDPFRDLAQDLGHRVETALKPGRRQLKPGRLLENAIKHGPSVCLKNRRSRHSVIKTVPILAIYPEIDRQTAALFPRLPDLAVDPLPILLRSHKKRIPADCPGKLVLPVAQFTGEILIIKNGLFAAAVQTREDHHTAGQVHDKFPKLLAAVPL